MLTTSEVRVETSTLCNFACPICPHGSSSFKRAQGVMLLDLFEMLLTKVRTEAPQVDQCTLSGMGETFMDGDALAKIRHAAARGFSVHLLTNGALLNPSLIDELLAIPVASIRFSLPGPPPGKVNSSRAVPSLAQAVVWRNLEYLSQRKQRTRLVVSATLTNPVGADVEALQACCKPLVDLLEIWRPHNWVRWARHRSGTRCRATCGRPLRGPIQIQVDGTVNMCCFDFNGELLLGDLKTATLEQIYSSPAYQRIVAYHQSVDSQDHLLCSHCDQLYQPDPSVLIFNSGFKPEERIGKTSTTYSDLC